MPSSLTWLDHDAEARERSLRILSLFQEKESRDELGLGGIRDSFADQLFPGTSTIQTRLRYMLFVPWLYRSLEESQVPPGDFARRADTLERDLIEAMRTSDEPEDGIFGARAGRRLERLPSSVYWAGLGTWGIRRFDLSQEQYHRTIGRVYERRARQADHHAESRRRGDDGDQTPDPAATTWHPRLPPVPHDFPRVARFALTVGEAEFLQDRIQRERPQSLLAHLARHCAPADVSAPWQHPDYASFSSEHRELLDHARLFSEVMHGASLIYNLALSEVRGSEALIEGYRDRLRRWLAALDYPELSHWSLDRLWGLTVGHGHTITDRTRRFVREWMGLLLTDRDGLLDDPQPRALVRERESQLKKSRSRFQNRRALDQWGGASGLGRLTYRWPTASRMLHDLHAGLQRAD